MARNVQTWIDEILGTIRHKLISSHVFPDHLVFCTLDDQQIVPPGDLFGTITPGPQRPVQNVITGAGLVCTLFTGTIGIATHVRLQVDEHQRDDAFLNDATFGAFGKFRVMLAALQMFDPRNKAGDEILAEPMRLADQGFAPRPRTQNGWGKIEAQYEISWLGDLTIATIPSAVAP